MVPQQHRRRRRRAALVRSERRLLVTRGPGGFGFTIAGQRPCVVSAVAAGGPAERAGLRAGDAIIAVDGTSVSRVPHASVARMVAGAPQAISLSVAPREQQPTDTEDTEPDERSRTRRRHPPPRRKVQQPPVLHHPGCHAAPSTSGVNELLQNINRAQLPTQAARLECRAVVGYLGTIETPRASSETPPGSVKTAVRRLRQERRPAAPVLLSVLPNVLVLRRQTGQTLAQYVRERIVFAACSSDADRRYFGLVTSAADFGESEESNSCHVFAVDPRLAEHESHVARAREFHIVCTRDPVAERCLEFPPSAEYVVGIIKGMYSLPTEDCTSPALQQISKLAIKGDSPGLANFSRGNRVALRMPRMGRRPCRHEENGRIDGQEFVANSPQPSNHSEITTTSSNSDSGIGFHNDGRNVADRILVVDFAGQPQPINRRLDVPRRPIGLVGNGFDDAAFLSNALPVVDGFAGQGRPLNYLDDVISSANDIPTQRRFPPNNEYQNYNIYSNLPSTSRMQAVYDHVYTENEGHYEFIPQNVEVDDTELTDAMNSVALYEEKVPDSCQSNEAESVENVTVISGTASKASMDTVSVYSSRSHEEARPARRKHLQASLDDMLVIGRREEDKKNSDDEKFVHPGTVKCKVRRSKPLNILSKTKQILTGRDKDKKRDARNRALSASAGDVCAAGADESSIVGACSEPDLRETEQASPFRRWTTSSGVGSSYRHHDHRNLYNKQMSEGTPLSVSGAASTGGVARWALGLEHVLADPAGASAFEHYLRELRAAENIRFWWSCEAYKACKDVTERATLAQQIWERHLSEEAPEQINIDAAALRATELRMAELPEDLFVQAQKHIFTMMKFDSYPRFLKSGIHAECARADLQGRPLPYGTIGSVNGIPPSPVKLKKSASNASERRRSGGGSLFQFKLRAGSKERPQNASTNSVASVTTSSGDCNVDVVKTTPSSGCSLCRVVLPDGATSVVGVDDTVTVKALVEKLLQRRNLACSSYDVMLKKDPNQSEGTVVDPSSSSTILGGRCCAVERRVVFKVRVRGRLVAVRCRPTRTLWHALRPLLRRYWPETQQHGSWQPRIVAEGGAYVHPEELCENLDGVRLTIVGLSEDELPRDPTYADGLSCLKEDCDYNGDTTNRLQDDADSVQSVVSSTSSAPGRVRAALRPGPPLHHHPPDFLENLRETQRQRLRTDSEPRSPPPLPPKPRTVHTPAIF